VKKQSKNIIKKFVVITTLLIFILFSGGLSFSIHLCDACGTQKPYYFTHPDCCQESEHLHKAEKDCVEHCCCDTKHHNDANCGTKHHCKTFHKYFKINSSFVKKDNLVKVQNDLLFSFSFLLNNYPLQIKKSEIQLYSDSSPPNIKAGGESFLHFIVQNITYC